jgi:hypothetical protein
MRGFRTSNPVNFKVLAELEEVSSGCCGGSTRLRSAAFTKLSKKGYDREFHASRIHGDYKACCVPVQGGIPGPADETEGKEHSGALPSDLFCNRVKRENWRSPRSPDSWRPRFDGSIM